LAWTLKDDRGADGFTIHRVRSVGARWRALLLAGAVVALLAVLAWVSRRHKKDRRRAATAAVSFPASIILLNVVLGGLGIWQSTLYKLPPLTMVSTAVLFLAVGTALMILMLSGYR